MRRRAVGRSAGAAAGRRGLPAGALLVCASLGWACASGPYAASGDAGARRLTHRDLGYSIAEPVWLAGPGWERIDLDEADLSLRGPGGASISLASTCARTRADAATLARHVTIGTRRTDLIAAGPFEQGGAQGWTQTFDTVERGVTLRVKAVTLRAGRCTYDWLLVGRPGPSFEQLEPAFDRWIETFRLPPADRSPDAAGAARAGGDS